MPRLRVLIGGETSGKVRDAFLRKGHAAMSCDLLPTDVPGPHYQGDMRDLLDPDAWDLAIFHPTCTYITNSGVWLLKDNPGRKIKPDVLYGAARRQARAEALEFITLLWHCGIPRIALENPQGCINTELPFMPRPQVIQPYQFGHDASKQTCLFLKNLTPLTHTLYVPPRLVDGKPRWANQTDSGQNIFPPSANRWKLRSETYAGIADAMTQWAEL